MDIVCTVCGTRYPIIQNPGKQNARKEKQHLWCFKCGTDREFINYEMIKADEFLVEETRSGISRKQKKKHFAELKKLIIPSPPIIGRCRHSYHPKAMTWSMIYKEGCLKKRCKHFSWISLSAKETWKQTY